MTTMPSPTVSLTDTVWDAFAAAHPEANILQSSAWARFKHRWGWEVRRLLWPNAEAPRAGVQVLVKRLPLGFSMLYVPRGPLVSADDNVALHAIFGALHALARAERALVLTVEPPWVMPREQAAALLHPFGFRPGIADVQPRATIVLDIRPSLDEILAQMKQKWRYNIRLSVRKGVQVREGGEADFAIYDALMRETGERDGFGVRPMAYYRDAWRAFQPDRSRLFIAEYEGEPLAALLAFHFGRVGYYLYGASSSRERNRMPNHALQWAAIQWAKANGCEWYDFWGIPPDVPDDGAVETWGEGGLWGVFRFKQGFGGQIVKYPGAFDAVYNRAAYWLYTRLRG